MPSPALHPKINPIQRYFHSPRVLVWLALLLILSGRPEHDRGDHQAAMRFRGFYRFAAYLLIAVTLANAVNSFAQCGPLECEDDPKGYWIAKYLP